MDGCLPPIWQGESTAGHSYEGKTDTLKVQFLSKNEYTLEHSAVVLAILYVFRWLILVMSPVMLPMTVAVCYSVKVRTNAGGCKVNSLL